MDNLDRDYSPEAHEYAPFYSQYVEQTRGMSLMDALRMDVKKEDVLLEGLSDREADGSYAPGKWSIKEVLLHCVDAERVFAYRALRILRGDRTPLPGYAQDPYVAASGARYRTLESIRRERLSVRATTEILFAEAPEEMLTNQLEADGQPVSARALVYIIPGHFLHHLGVLEVRYPPWAK